MPLITALASRTTRSVLRHTPFPLGTPYRLYHTRIHSHLRTMSDDSRRPAPPGPLSRIAALSRQLFPTSPFSTKASRNDTNQGQLLGNLKLGPDVEIPVFEPHDSSRLPMQRLLLDLEDPNVLGDLTWMGKKWQLGQDILCVIQQEQVKRTRTSFI